MAGERYNEEFKIAAVKQVTENGHSIADVAKRLGITTKSLYSWRDRYGQNAQAYQEKQSSTGELRNLKAELKRVTEERDILRRPPCSLPWSQRKIHVHKLSHPPLLCPYHVSCIEGSSRWFLCLAS